VWAAPSPRAALESVPELDVFAHAGQLARDAGRTLRLRQYWTFDLVPRRAGTLRLPELRFAYFDPAERRYAEASAPGLAIAVGEAPARGPAPRPREVEEPEPRPALDARHVLLGLALTVGGLALLVRMARRGLRRRPSDALHLVLDRAREDMMETVYRRDPVGHANALAVGVREALGTRVLGAATASAEELLGLAPPTGPLRDAAYLLIQLDAIRFGGSGALPTMQEYRRVITRWLSYRRSSARVSAPCRNSTTSPLRARSLRNHVAQDPGDWVKTERLGAETILRVDPEALVRLAAAAVRDVSHLFRPGHLAQLRKISTIPRRRTTTASSRSRC